MLYQTSSLVLLRVKWRTGKKNETKSAADVLKEFKAHKRAINERLFFSSLASH